MDDSSSNVISGNVSEARSVDVPSSNPEGIEETQSSSYHHITNNESTTEELPIPEDGTTSSLETRKKLRGWKRYLGVIFTLAAINTTALGSNILKLLSHIDAITTCMYGFLIGAILTVPYVWFKWKIYKHPVMANVLPLGEHKKVLFFMWLRATSTILLNISLIWSFKFIMVSDSRTIFAASVVVVTIFGCIFFKEKCGIVTAIVSVVVLCGIGVMTKPPILTGKSSFDHDTLVSIGISIAFFCMLCSSVNMLVLRFLGNVYHGVLNSTLFAWGFLSILPFAIGLGKMVIPGYTSWDVGGIIFYGILSLLANTLLVLALSVEEAGVVALLRTCELIFTFIWQMILLKVYPDWISSLGAVLVLTGVTMVGLRKWLEGKDEESTIRKRLKWLLL